MRCIGTFIVLVLLATGIFAGNIHIEKKDTTDNFIINSNKKAIGFVFTEPESEIENKVITNLPKTKLPEPYLLINLRQPLFSKPEISLTDLNEITDNNQKELVNWLNKNKAGQAILTEWFNRQPNGSFNLNFLKQHSFIHPSVKIQDSFGQPVTEADIYKLSVSPVNHTYLVIHEWKSLQTMEEYYDQTRTVQNKRILNGYYTDYRSYIFKFDFNQSVAKQFFYNYWPSQEESELKEKEQNGFESSEFPFFLISVNENQIAATQQNPGRPMASPVQKSKEQLLTDLINLVVEKTIADLEPKSFISEEQNIIKHTEPIIATKKINDNTPGFDRRFAVFENRISEDGKIEPTRMGMVKSMKFFSDSITSPGNPNYVGFYQIAGKKLNATGMYLKEKKDLGLNLTGGNSFNAMSAATARVEYYLSKTMGDMILPGKTGKGLTSVKIYFEGGQRKKTYSFDGAPENFTFTRGSFGINKDYYPVRFMHWGPFIGYGLEYTKWENSGNVISTNFAEAGLRLGINLIHNLQIMGSATYYHLINSVLMNEKRDVIEPKFNYSKIFSDRTGIGYSIGLRLML